MPSRLIITALLFLSCLFASTAEAGEFFREKTVHREGVTLHYVFQDARSAMMEPKMTEVVVAGFRHYTRLFGARPRDREGREYSALKLSIRHGEHVSGEADPETVMLVWADRPTLGHMDWKTVLLHEVFHLWSAESFRYADQQEQWFNEGVSEFYAWQAAARLGLVSPAEALSVAAFPIGTYHSARNLGRVPLRQAAMDGRAKRENYFLVYHGGWVAAMLLDHDIRVRTGNLHSLDDLMRWLHANYPAQQRRYGMEDLLSGLREAVGLEYAGFFRDHIDGVRTLPAASHFDIGAALWAWEFQTPGREVHETLYRTLGIRSAP